MEEAYTEVVEIVASLAVTCVNLRGEDRPTMRKVEMAPESIQISREQSLGNISTEKLEERNNVARNFVPTQERRSMKEGTRQYSLEEEFLLSASLTRGLFMASMRRLLVLFAAAVALQQQATVLALQPAAVLPGCPTTCGDVAVPFPFGIGAGCYYSGSPGFNLTCDNRNTDGSPRLLLGDAGVFQVLNISIANATVRAARVIGMNITYGAGNSSDEGRGAWRGLGDGGGPFALSEDRNELVVVWGCDVVALLTDGGSNDDVTISGCASFCPKDIGHTFTGVVYDVHLCSLDPTQQINIPRYTSTQVLIAEQRWLVDMVPFPTQFDETVLPP
uniref:Wall-associated receptor kinase galacturonan-binding domain-containing protein n=1 Tax=Leersia perrieri TaxID=77586 RepID=A0A0D9XGT2_9ORYZ